MSHLMEILLVVLRLLHRDKHGETNRCTFPAFSWKHAKKEVIHEQITEYASWYY
jgi:hypothetical protein